MLFFISCSSPSARDAVQYNYILLRDNNPDDTLRLSQIHDNRTNTRFSFRDLNDSFDVSQAKHCDQADYYVNEDTVFIDGFLILPKMGINECFEVKYSNNNLKYCHIRIDSSLTINDVLVEVCHVYHLNGSESGDFDAYDSEIHVDFQKNIVVREVGLIGAKRVVIREIHSEINGAVIPESCSSEL